MCRVRCKRMECRRQTPSSLNAPYWCEAGTLQGPAYCQHARLPQAVNAHPCGVESVAFLNFLMFLKFLWCLWKETLTEFVHICAL